MRCEWAPPDERTCGRRCAILERPARVNNGAGRGFSLVLHSQAAKCGSPCAFHLYPLRLNAAINFRRKEREFYAPQLPIASHVAGKNFFHILEGGDIYILCCVVWRAKKRTAAPSALYILPMPCPRCRRRAAFSPSLPSWPPAPGKGRRCKRRRGARQGRVCRRV